MAHSPVPAVVVDGLTYSLSDGSVILDDISARFPPGHTGLIGPNGSGKSTLLALIAGRLTPTAGTIRASGRVHLVPQRLPSDGRVADLLGISGVLAALRAVEAGSVDQAHFDAVGDDWDVEARALAELDALGFAGAAPLLERSVATLSGGEATRVALAGARLARAEVTLLDEPTNNLDTATRRWLYDALDGWQGALIVVSHDRELLDRVDALVDLDRRGVVSFGGNFHDYAEFRAARQETAERRLKEADAGLARAKRQAQVELQREAQRNRAGRRERAADNVNKMEAHYFQNRSERGSAAKAVAHQKAVAQAAEARSEADDAARTHDVIRVELPDTTVASGKEVLKLTVGDATLDVVGPERIRLEGANGSGKSTLLGTMLSGEAPAWAAGLMAGVTVSRMPAVPVGVLAQRLDELDAFDSAIDAVRDAAPARTPHDARALLARFLIRGDRADQAPSTMSGGERFRVGLARVLFRDPAPQLLVLDEPTNNLDLDSVEQLVAALEDYRGALIVVTHDEHLARELRVSRTWSASRDGQGPVRVADRFPELVEGPWPLRFPELVEGP
ncbi:ABC-F family ATP-binding cassette domain-containing protein [Tessaracoccus palaemonis]|uniref:ATP-binding cassette domain-containing protein n=1 Tax=Tessaracoccus palaemonis TaxID=2829499 RepID=A0ABX8SI39_9ACTN|nr:ABC-F family ATP-binding cassette domain-containing protein [Tessaracoccus palaemonis]QXT63051.1 ATP-binding cassette domain-containing protein [Tessaracoccus palaemonis]